MTQPAEHRAGTKPLAGESGGGGLGTRPLRLSGVGSPRPPPQDADETSEVDVPGACLVAARRTHCAGTKPLAGESGGGGLGSRPLRLSGGGSPRPPPQDEDEPRWPAVGEVRCW